ncbi:MAG: hypothetical protein H6R42_783 [Nitrospirae bacterium]|nr:hypothetical protein [Nitrospirota bacterium]
MKFGFKESLNFVEIRNHLKTLGFHFLHNVVVLTGTYYIPSIPFSLVIRLKLDPLRLPFDCPGHAPPLMIDAGVILFSRPCTITSCRMVSQIVLE